MYVLHRRWHKVLRQAMLPQLTQTQRDQVTRFQRKSTGWFTVAAGAALLATGRPGRSSSITAGPSGRSGCWSR